MRSSHLCRSVVADQQSNRKWTLTTIGALCREDRRQIDPTSREAAMLPYLGLEHIEPTTGRILKAPGNEADAVQSLTFYFSSAHVLYGKLRPYLNKVALPDFEGRCSTELIPLLPRSGVSRRFLAHILRRPQTVHAAMTEVTGARMPRANLDHLMRLSVWIPASLAEQDQHADHLDKQLSQIRVAQDAARQQIELLCKLQEQLMSRFSARDGDPLSTGATNGTT